jgi:hypothetical protein
MAEFLQTLVLMAVPVVYFLTIRTVIRRENRALGFGDSSKKRVLRRQAQLRERA